jgi:hypothetical protein
VGPLSEFLSLVGYGFLVRTISFVLYRPGIPSRCQGSRLRQFIHLRSNGFPFRQWEFFLIEYSTKGTAW